MENEKSFKEIILPKIQAATQSLMTNAHSRVNLSDFSSIHHKKIGSSFAFYNKVYSNKFLEYFNEEENTDFLIFENNKVYIDYNSNLFTFHKVDEGEKILGVYLDNQEIIGEEMDVDDEDLSNEILKNKDLITLDYFPLSISHCNITLCYDQDLPQVLSSELLVQLLQLFPIAKNNSLVCGYDSLGGGCVINHLHFEFLMLDDFTDIPALPIESVNAFPVFETKLKHKKEEEISLFDCELTLRLSKISDYYAYCWKIEVVTDDAMTDGEHEEPALMENTYQNSISHLANVFLSILTDQGIPHNLVITNQGKTFYLFPRKFEQKEHPVNTCWNDLSGLITCKTEEYYNSITEEKVVQFFKNNISLEDKDFEELTNKIVDKVDAIYEITKNN